MAQISKLKTGSTVDKYSQAKLNFDNAYANADADTKAWVDGFIRFNLNYQDADKMNRSSKKDYLTLIYTIGTLMATNGRGGYTKPNPVVEAPTKNIFNGYSETEATDIANELARQYIDKNSVPKGTGSSASVSSGGNHYNYRWNDDWDTGWGLEGESVADKLNNFTSLLANNVGQMLKHSDAGYKIHGVKSGKLKQYRDAHIGLTSLLNDLKSGVYNGKDLDAIMKLAGYARQVGVDSESFKEYFKDYLPKETQLDKNRKAWEAKGYKALAYDQSGLHQDLINQLQKNSINLMRGADNALYAFDSQYNGFAPLKYINTDYRLEGQENSPFNQGIFTDENGRIWAGDVTTMEQDNPYFSIMDKYRTGIKNKRKDLFKHYTNFDKKFGYLENDLINRMTNATVDGKMVNLNNFADVSGLFKTDRPVIAINSDGSPFTDEGDDYGNIRFKTGTLFYYVGDDGHIHSTDLNGIQQKVGEYNLSGWNEGNDYKDILDLNIKDLSTDITLGKNMSGKSGVSDFLHFGDFWLPSQNIHWWGTDSIKKNPQEWSNTMLKILAKPAAQRNKSELVQLENFDGLNNPENILVFIQSLVKNGNVEVTQDMYDNWMKVMLESRKRRTPSNKQGGILFAAKGLVIDIYGNPVEASSKTDLTRAEKAELGRQDLISRALEAGYNTASEYTANMRKPGETGFTTTDYVRLGAIAADIASIPAAFVAGYGTAVSAGLGVGSSLATLATDIAEDGFQLHDISGFGVNLALDVAGLFGGAGKVGKIVKNCAKFAPLLIGAWDAMANGDQYKELFDKMQKGKSLTVLDWKTLARGIAIVAGGTRAGASSYRQRQIANNAKLASTEPEFKLTVKKGAGKEEITLNAEQVKALQEGDFNAANAKLKEIKGPDYELIPDKNSRFGNGWKGIFKRGNSSENPLAGKSLSEAEVSPEQIFAVNQNSDYNGRISSNRSWFSNAVNRVGNRLGLASDVDMAGNNVVGRMGLLRGDKKPTWTNASSETIRSTGETTGPKGGPTSGETSLALVRVNPAQEAQTVITEDLGYPAIIGNAEHIGNGWYMQRKTPLALGSKRVSAMQRMNLIFGPSSQPIILYSSSRTNNTGKQLSIPFKQGGTIDRFGEYLKSHK